MSLADQLRRLAKQGQYGHSRTPSGYYMGTSYCSFYWDNRGVVADHATWERVAALSSRYHSFVTYCREVLPEWEDVRTIHFADNSVEVEQVSRVSGETRRRMVTAPSGDACF